MFQVSICHQKFRVTAAFVSNITLLDIDGLVQDFIKSIADKIYTKTSIYHNNIFHFTFIADFWFYYSGV